MKETKLFTLITKADTSIVEAAKEKNIEKEEFIDKLPPNLMDVVFESGKEKDEGIGAVCLGRARCSTLFG